MVTRLVKRRAGQRDRPKIDEPYESVSLNEPTRLLCSGHTASTRLRQVVQYWSLLATSIHTITSRSNSSRQRSFLSRVTQINGKFQKHFATRSGHEASAEEATYSLAFCLSTWRERAEHLLRHLCSCSARSRRRPSASAAGDKLPLPPIFKSPEPGSDSASAAATPPYGNVRAMIGASGARRAPAEPRGRVAHGRVTGAGNETRGV